MTIYTDSRIPYFYIIRHIPSGKLYAGAKWASDSNPENFMKPKGYPTSSKAILKLIESDGLDSFEILRIDTYCDGMPVRKYEALFLQIIDARNNILYLNEHNNDGYTIWCDESIEKANKTKEDKYGSSNMFKTEHFKSTMIKNTMDNHGVEYPCQRPELRKLNSERNFARLEDGNHNFGNSEWQRNNQYKRVANGNHPFVGGEIQSITNQRRIADGSHWFVSNENKIRASKNAKKEHFCEFCNRIIRGVSNYKARHGKNCKMNPSSIRKIYQCLICNIDFPSKPSLSRHTNKLH